MVTKTQKMKWQLYKYKKKKLLLWGLKNGYAAPYDEELIKKLRTIYDGGLPASILLLSNGMSNGRCYDRALLMSRAFLDEEDDVQLVYATIDGLRLNPYLINNDSLLSADHCFVERTMPDGYHVIYDTSEGFMYDKRLYWLMEHPKVRKVNQKKDIIEYLKLEGYDSNNIERDKYASPILLPMIEQSCGKPSEMYSRIGNLLQREIEHYKQTIDYDAVCKEVDEDMRRLGLRK